MDEPQAEPSPLELSEDEFIGYEWDDEKSEQTLRDRGFDFEFASRAFDGPYLERSDVRHSEREARYVVIGKVEEFILRVVWTPRHPYKRIISARVARASEEKRYYGYCKTIKH